MENNIVYGKKRSEHTLKLIEKLRTFSKEKDFILGVLSNATHEEDREVLLQFIENDKDVTPETIILYSLELGNLRDN